MVLFWVYFNSQLFNIDITEKQNTVFESTTQDVSDSKKMEIIILKK